jgi:hypothetical protein
MASMTLGSRMNEMMRIAPPQRRQRSGSTSEESGALIKVGDSLFYHRAALDELDAKLRTYLASHAEMTMADFKDLTGLSRKFAVPLLEYFDRRGVTARTGDSRRPGPLLVSGN